MEKYVEMAKDLGATNAIIIKAKDIVLDPRTSLKCLWGCEYDIHPGNIKCGKRGLNMDESKAIIRRYDRAVLIHNHDAHKLSIMAHKVERAAFLDGYYLASIIQCCSFCKECNVSNDQPCRLPEKIRPCEQAFNINVYQTARNHGLPIHVLTDRSETPNRYAFVMID